jgi:hypothetical protein
MKKQAKSKKNTRSGPGLSASEAANYLSIKIDTLAKWRQRGKGPPFSDALGRDPRYHIDDLDSFLWGDGVAVNSAEAYARRKKRASAEGVE